MGHLINTAVFGLVALGAATVADKPEDPGTRWFRMVFVGCALMAVSNVVVAAWPA